MVEEPFPHHGPLTPDRVHGRDAVVDDLLGRVRTRRPTAVQAPDRYGTTTVLGCVDARLHAADTVARVDLFELRSWADLAVRLDAALAAVPAPRRAQLDRVAAGRGPELGTVAAALSRPGHPSPAAIVDRLLDVVAEHARTHPTVLLLDDCSSIARVDGAVERVRAWLAEHREHLGLIAAGSERATLVALVGAESPPARDEVIELPPLSLLVLTRIVDAGWGGSPPPSLASRIHAFTRGHPQRSMQLADAAWATANDGVDPVSVWSVALERCRTAGEVAHATRFAGLQPADQAVMRLAATDGAIFGRGAGLLSLSRSSAQLARRRLVERGQIVDRDDRVWVVDPLYADWIRRRFPF